MSRQYSTRWNSKTQSQKRKNRVAPMMALGAATLLGSQFAWSEEAQPAQVPASVAPAAPTAPVEIQPAPTSAPATTLQEVVVTGDQERKISSPKFTEPLRDIPQTITVISEKTIEEQGATTLRDVLRNVPGISIQAGEGGVPAGDNLSIRGFGARTDMFIDGVRDFGGYSRDSFNFEQVEVVKGPASSYAGRGSTGGAINMSSKSPRLQDFNRATVGWGTDEYVRSTIDTNHQVDDKSALRLNALWHSQEVSGRDAVEAERWGIAPSFATGLGTDTRTKFGYFHLTQNNTPDYGIPWVPVSTGTLAGSSNDQPGGVDYSNFYGLKQRDYEKTITDIGTIQVEHDINPNLSFRNVVQVGRTKRDSVVTAPRFVDANAVSTSQHLYRVTRQIQSRDQVDTIVADQLDVTAKFKTFGIEHALVSGMELSQENSVNYARTGATSTTDLFNPDPNDPRPGLVTRTGAKTEATSKSNALYAFDTVKLNSMFELVAGIRWDRFNVNQTTTTAANVAKSLERTDQMVSWRGGLVVKPAEKGSLYASYGTSFNPSAEGLSIGNAANSTNNINVDPEESATAEVGTKWDLFDDRLSVAGALFRTTKTNARTEDPYVASDVIALEGEQKVEGAELSVSGQLMDELNVVASYTYMESEVTKARSASEVGRELANTPKHSASLWTVYAPVKPLEFGLGVQFVDSRWNTTTDSVNTSGVVTGRPKNAPSYWLADAMIAYHVNSNITLRLNGYNLVDKEYIDRVGGGHFIPGAGRSGTLTTEVKF